MAQRRAYQVGENRFRHARSHCHLQRPTCQIDKTMLRQTDCTKSAIVADQLILCAAVDTSSFCAIIITHISWPLPHSRSSSFPSHPSTWAFQLCVMADTMSLSAILLFSRVVGLPNNTYNNVHLVNSPNAGVSRLWYHPIPSGSSIPLLPDFDHFIVWEYKLGRAFFFANTKTLRRRYYEQ